MSNESNTPAPSSKNLRVTPHRNHLLFLNKHALISREHLLTLLSEEKIARLKLGEVLLERGYILPGQLGRVRDLGKTIQGYWQRRMQMLGVILSSCYYSVVTTKTPYAGVLKSLCVPFLHCYACPVAVASCPIGSLQHFAAIRTLPYYVGSYIGLIGLSVGRMVCGWLCPFGLLQDLIHKIPSRKIPVPKVLTYLKYVLFVVLVLLVPYLTGIKWFSQLCPNGALIAGIPWVLWNPTNPVTHMPTVAAESINFSYYLKMLILALFLGWFIFAKRPFCRTTCPMGAVLALFNRISFVRLQVDHTCTKCTVCREICPVDISVYKDPNSPECIRCLRCTACPSVKTQFAFSKSACAASSPAAPGKGA